MKEIDSIKCGLTIQSYASKVAELEKVISDNMFMWECCIRGGNKTENGGCNIVPVDQVINFFDNFDTTDDWRVGQFPERPRSWGPRARVRNPLAAITLDLMVSSNWFK